MSNRRHGAMAPPGYAWMMGKTVEQISACRAGVHTTSDTPNKCAICEGSMNRRVLVLDDEELRHRTFQQRFENDTVDAARTVAEALAFVACHKYDVAYLDHDLDAEEDGHDFICQMIAAIPKTHWPRHIVVHSLNPSGTSRMMARLGDAGISSEADGFRI